MREEGKRNSESQSKAHPGGSEKSSFGLFGKAHFDLEQGGRRKEDEDREGN